MKKGKKFLFNGLGFPIVLINPGYKKVRGEEILDIDYEKLQRSAFEALIRKPSSLSGSELRFIRLYMEMTCNVFADYVGVDRSSVGKWEKKDLAWTGMTIAAETLVRVRMTQHLKHSIDDEMPHLEPGARKQAVGSPIELAA